MQIFIANMPLITRGYLARVYRISQNKLRDQLRELGITHRTMLSAKDLEKIYNELGDPKKLRDIAARFAE